MSIKPIALAPDFRSHLLRAISGFSSVAEKSNGVIKGIHKFKISPRQVRDLPGTYYPIAGRPYALSLSVDGVLSLQYDGDILNFATTNEATVLNYSLACGRIFENVPLIKEFDISLLHYTSADLKAIGYNDARDWRKLFMMLFGNPHNNPEEMISVNIAVPDSQGKYRIYLQKY